MTSQDACSVMVRPFPEHRWRLATSILLASVFFERLAFYSLLGNLVFFVSRAPYRWTSPDAIHVVFLFCSVVFMCPLLAGWISDTYIGKYWTIIVGYFFYLISYVFLPLLYNPKNVHLNKPSPLCFQARKNVSSEETRYYTDESCNIVLSLALPAIGIGAACIRGVVPPLGAMQMEANSKRLKRFFPLFYWIFNAAAMIAYSIVAFWQQNWSMFQSYTATYVSVGVSALLFLIGSPFYITDWPNGSPLNEVFGVLWEATKLSSRRSCCRKQPSDLPESQIVPALQTSSSSLNNNENDDDSVLMETRVPSTPSFLDRAQEGLGGTHTLEAVDRTRIFLRTVLLLASLLPYWIVFMQMHSTFLIQGLHMDLWVELINLQMPISWLLLVEVVSVLLAVPIFSCLLSRSKSRGRPVSPHFRMGLGMLLAAVSMGCAGIVEYFRITVFIEKGPCKQNVSDTIFFASSLKIYWQVPQYAFMGCSDALTTVAALECAYTLAPRSSQSILSGMLYFSTGLASLIAFFLSYFTDSLVFVKHSDTGSVNSKNRHLSTYFFSLGIFQVLGLAVFVAMVRWMRRPSVVSPQQTRPPSPVRATGVYDPSSSAPPVIE